MRFVILGILIAVSLFIFGCAGAQPSAPVCGNSQLEAGEQCESGLSCTDSSKICSQCQCVQQQVQKAAAPVCGNGKLEGEELCEKGVACPQGGVCDEKLCACSYGAADEEQPVQQETQGGQAGTPAQETAGGASSNGSQPAPSQEAPFCGDGKLAEN